MLNPDDVASLRASAPRRAARGEAATRWSRLARRAHLYCGLAMLPWVLLYAVSGLLFNHPSLASDVPVTRFSVDALGTDVRTAVPSAEVAAPALVEALRQAAPGAAVTLAGEPAPAFQRSLGARGKLGEDDVSVSLDVEGRGGSLRVTPPSPRPVPGSLTGVETLDVPGLELAAFEAMATGAVSELAGPGAELTVSSAPKLRVGATIDGEPWILTYDPKARTLEYARADEAEPVKLGRLLARLHMTHVYPESVGVKWIHALVVDLTVACLVLWCLTGLWMAWQLRRLRRVSLLVLGSGIAASVALLARVIPGLLE